MHPRFLDFLSIANSYSVSVALETNGTLLTDSHIEALSSSSRPFVSVSLDGPNAAVHETIRNVPGCFSAATNAIQRLVKASISTEIIMTLQRDNAACVQEMIQFAENLRVNALKINIMQPVGGGDELKRQGKALNISELIEIGAWVEVVDSSVEVFYDHPPAFKPLHKLCNGIEWKCSTCRFTNIIGLLPDGSLSFCGVGQEEKNLVLGDKTDSLAKVWDNSVLLDSLRANLPGKLQEVCSLCVFRDRCLGGCIAQTYQLTGDFYKGFWYCQEAFEKGLFPKSRLF